MFGVQYRLEGSSGFLLVPCTLC